MSRAAPLILLLSATLAGQAANTTPTTGLTGSGVIRGRVVASPSGDRLRHARVSATAPSGEVEALSDENGVFTLVGLPPGRLTVTAVKPGYLKQTSSAEVSDAGGGGGGGGGGGQIDFALTRAAVISGLVVDETAEPVAGARVAVVRVTSSATGARTVTVAAGDTDDLGGYRITGLPAGNNYLVETSAGITRAMLEFDARSPTRGRGAPRFFYPGVTDIGAAQRIVVEAGEERAGIVFTVPVRQEPGFPGPAAPARVDVGTRADALPPEPGVGQTPTDRDPRTNAVIKGRIVNSNGVALQGAHVIAIAGGGSPGARPLNVYGNVRDLMPMAAGSNRPPSVASTGVDGSYELTVPNVPPRAWFRVAATRAGYQGGEYGQTNPLARGEPVPVNPGEVVDHIDLSLQRPAVITGRIVDDLGEPVEGATVRTAELRYVNGRRQLVDSGSLRRTDDLGRYRLFGLRPGRYAVSASVGQILGTQPSADLPGYGTTYFPGVIDPQLAQFVQVNVAQEVAGVDFSLSQMKSARVSGTAVDASGDPVTGGIALMPSARSGGNTEIQMGARIDRKGSFEFSNVPPGDYVLQVVRGRSNPWNEGEFAFRFVTVTDGDVTGLEMQTSSGSSLSGRVVADSGEIARIDTVEVIAVPVDIDRSPRLGGPPGRARAQQDGQFELKGINGPRRLEVARAPAGWSEKAIFAGGVDVTDQILPFGRDDQSLEDIQVVLTNRTTEIAVSLSDVRGVVTSDLAVLAFAVDEAQWYPGTRFRKRATAAGNGGFSVDGLPAADYFLVAAQAPRDPGEWQDPEVLQRLAARATRVHLTDGQHVSVTLRPLVP